MPRSASNAQPRFGARSTRSSPSRRRSSAASSAEHRPDYELLQLYDRFSLYFCLRDVEAGEEAEVQGYRFAPLGPWHVRLEPFPFAEGPARFSLLRHVVPKRRWAQAELQRELRQTPPERVEITIE